VRRRVALAALAGTLWGSGVVQAGFAPAGATACADVVALRTLTIAIKPVTQSYAVGSIASVPVQVTRPAKEDPLQVGIPVPPVVSEPASGVIVGLGLHIGTVFRPAYAKTDSNGDATVKVKIPAYAPAASVNVEAYTYHVLIQVPCYTVQENGYSRKSGLFKTTK